LAFGLVLFVSVYRIPERLTIALIVLLIPIQIIDSRFGTSNTVLVYLVVFAFMMQARLRLAPMMVPIGLLLFAYAISFAMSHPSARMQHLFYLIGFAGNVLLFYLVYNFIVRSRDWHWIFSVLFLMNVVVIVACGLEILAAQSEINILGVKEWSVQASRARQGRLVGPFGSTHTTADYLVTQCMMLAYFLIHEPRRKYKLYFGLLFACNFMVLVGTGDRGGFVGLVVGVGLFLILFHRDIGTFRSVRLLAAGVLLFVFSSIVVMNFTDFGVLFDRLSATEVESGLTDSRQRGFSNGLSYFQESPITGLGPKLGVSTKSRQVGNIPYRPYPHMLPMHILATTGLLGFIAWAIFFVAFGIQMIGAARAAETRNALTQLPKLGLLIMLLFFAGELRIEFLRAGFLDYQNYMFVLFGTFIACADLAKSEQAVAEKQPPVASASAFSFSPTHADNAGVGSAAESAVTDHASNRFA
jgi:O-antigen ligase